MLYSKVFKKDKERLLNYNAHQIIAEIMWDLHIDLQAILKDNWKKKIKHSDVADALARNYDILGQFRQYCSEQEHRGAPLVQAGGKGNKV